MHSPVFGIVMLIVCVPQLLACGANPPAAAPATTMAITAATPSVTSWSSPTQLGATAPATPTTATNTPPAATALPTATQPATPHGTAPATATNTPPAAAASPAAAKPSIAPSSTPTAVTNSPAASSNPAEAQQHLNQGKSLLNEEHSLRLRDALAEFNQALALDPTYGDAYGYRALTYYHLRDQQSANRDFDRAIELSTDDDSRVVWYFWSGRTYFAWGDNDRALARFEQALALRSAAATLYLHRGYTYLAMNNTERAMADFDKAITLAPEYADALLARGGAFAMIGNDERAVADITKGSKLAAGYYATAWESLLNKLQPASGGLNATERRAAVAWAYASSARWAMSSAYFVSALNDTAIATSLTPDDPYMALLTGSILANRGGFYHDEADGELAKLEFTRAIDLATQRINQEPSAYLAYYIRAVARNSGGDTAGARIDMQKAIDVCDNPTDKAQLEKLLAQFK